MNIEQLLDEIINDPRKMDMRRIRDIKSAYVEEKESEYALAKILIESLKKMKTILDSDTEDIAYLKTEIPYLLGRIQDSAIYPLEEDAKKLINSWQKDIDDYSPATGNDLLRFAKWLIEKEKVRS